MATYTFSVLYRGCFVAWLTFYQISFRCHVDLKYWTEKQKEYRLSNGSKSTMYVYLIITRICSTCRKTSRSFPHSWLITGFVTRVARRMSLVEQEPLTLQEHLSSPPVFSGVRVTRSLVFCVMFFRSLFVLFLSAVMLSVLRFMDSDCPFGIFKLFLNYMCTAIYTWVTVHNW